MTTEQRNQILENAYIPQEWWDNCYITEEGMIFTPRFNEEGVMESTGEQGYNEWLANKDKPPVVEQTPEEKITTLQGQVVSLEDELMTTNIYMTDLELEVMELKSLLAEKQQ